MILVFWLLIIRPQQKQRKKQEQFLGALKAGDKVVTASGFIGRIVSIEGDVVNLELTRDVRVKVVKSQVVSNYKEDGDSKSS
jgi:preprotein translocase subunit YajC